MRTVDLELISDGRKYTAESMVRLGCDGCDGKSMCCHDMCDTIILDPFDIFELCKGLGVSFETLLAGAVELGVHDGLILPNIKKQPSTRGCGYLDSLGRCSIHDFRPGFCRLFPLGRVYDDEKIYYVNQINECTCASGVKTKVKKWLGIFNLSDYEKYNLKWHSYLKKLEDVINNSESDEEIRALNMKMLNVFYIKPYDTNNNFYEQFYLRFESINN